MSSEFRRYRQALLVLYFTIGGAGALLVGTSVVYDLFWRRGPHRPTPPPADMLACNHDVRRLLEGLGETAAQLQLDAVKGDAQDLGGRWVAFDEEWRDQWKQIDVRCQFDELAGTQPLGYERMAQVHRKLATIRLTYRDMITRFDEQIAPELEGMREALDKSRADLEKRLGTSGTEPNKQ